MNKDYFGYNLDSTVPKDAFRISPSQISRFFDNTTDWFREFLLGEEGFTGNTNTALGNCVHAAAEMYVKEGVVHYDQIENYISNLKGEYDTSYIRSQYRGMIDVLLSGYLRNNMPQEAELFMATEMANNIYAAGTIDSLIGDTIVDYKTTSAKTPPNKISRSYWFQQLTYAYIARKNGYTVNRVRLVYVTTNEMDRYSEKTGKRLKDYPSVVSIINYEITDQDMEIIENTLKLITETVQLWESNPELRHIIAQDMRLKPKAPAKLFKN